MASGMHEDPARSITPHLDAVEYPVWREQLAKIAAGNDATVDVINLLKSLPRGQYESKEQVLRDLGEAARRFALGRNDEDPLRDRRNIGPRHN
jgi:hypothetical protein